VPACTREEQEACARNPPQTVVDVVLQMDANARPVLVVVPHIIQVVGEQAPFHQELHRMHRMRSERQSDVSHPGAHWMDILRSFQPFEPLRDEPRFKSLVARMRFP